MTYDRIITKVLPGDIEKLERLLRFMLYTKRPLRLEEAVDALAVTVGSTPGFDTRDRMPVPHEIVALAPGLINIVELSRDPLDCDGFSLSSDDMSESIADDSKGINEYSEVRLSHFTVKEYLLKERKSGNGLLCFESKMSRIAMATVCLTYLDCALTATNTEDIRTFYPFFDYSAEYWAMHLRGLEDENLASAGDEAMIDFLISRNADVNRDSAIHGSPLCMALRKRHVEIVKKLLQRGADANRPVRGGSWKTMLDTAAEARSMDLVEALMAGGADLHSPDGHPLLAAVAGGSIETVKFMLSRDVKVHDQEELMGTSLHEAAIGGDAAIVSILVDAGADVNADLPMHGSPLQIAACLDHEAIIEILLDAGAVMESSSKWAVSVLRSAVGCSNLNVVDLLLLRGARMKASDIRSGKMGMDLWVAPFDILDELIQRFGPVPKTTFGATYFHMLFASDRDEDIQRAMTECDLMERDLLGRSAFHYYSLGSRRGTSALLTEAFLQQSPDIDDADNHGWTALHWATHCENARIVRELIDRGANAALMDVKGRTAFDIARLGNNRDIVDIIAEKFPGISTGLISLWERRSTARVFCDLCGKQKPNKSYHCTVCPDFDLCFRCVEDAHTAHPDHLLIDAWVL
ncbi:Ankyrin repeat-containing protein 11 [Elsinoe fawcettii]|nr:Ankyrin repeat-containing protein 11 [Elsinoe fawcettii]